MKASPSLALTTRVDRHAVEGSKERKIRIAVTCRRIYSDRGLLGWFLEANVRLSPFAGRFSSSERATATRAAYRRWHAERTNSGRVAVLTGPELAAMRIDRGTCYI